MSSFCETSRLRVCTPGAFSRTLKQDLHCSPLVAALLEMRGFDSETEIDRARTWISPSLELLMGDVDLGTGALVAKEEWLSAASFGNVVVYGDYDVDGISATVLAVELARAKSREVRYFIPERHSEGYGIHRRVIASLADMGLVDRAPHPVDGRQVLVSVSPSGAELVKAAGGEVRVLGLVENSSTTAIVDRIRSR